MIAEEPAKRRRPNILVTGTPGTGKTTFSQLLNNSLSFQYVNIGEVVREQQLYTQWNQQFDVPEYDQGRVKEFVAKHLNIAQGGLLFDFHTPDIFPAEWIDLVVIMRCENQQLYDRLQQRGYAPHKITQNIECEIFQEIARDAREHFDQPSKIVELRNEHQPQMQSNLQLTLNWLMKYKQSLPPQ